MESLLVLFCFIQLAIPGEDAPHAKANQTCWNSIGIADVATVDKHTIDDGTVWDTSTTRLLQNYFKEKCTCVWVANRSALLNAWLGRIAPRLNLDDTYDDTFWTPRSGGQFLLPGRHCTPRYGQIDFKTVTHDRCPRFFLTVTTEEEASLFACPGSQLNSFSLPWRSAYWLRRFKRSLSRFWYSPYLLNMAMYNMRGPNEKKVVVCSVMITLFGLTYLP